MKNDNNIPDARFEEHETGHLIMQYGTQPPPETKEKLMEHLLGQKGHWLHNEFKKEAKRGKER